MADLRFGLGFDTHPRGSGGPLHLGGVTFEDEAGLAGHSDGDVICHALADALLGAGTLGDVGEHFADTDPAVEGISGPELLRRTVGLLEGRGLRPVFGDVVLVAARPEIGPRRDEIRKALADALGVPPESVSVKASRPEGLGLSGDGAGCLALAVVSAAES
jgi:2-C-methyl-D-erythritol 2,4-cyclodiphosphate synthase